MATEGPAGIVDTCLQYQWICSMWIKKTCRNSRNISVSLIIKGLHARDEQDIKFVGCPTHVPGWIPDIRLIQIWIELSLTKQDSKCTEKNTSKFAFLRKYTRCSLFIQRYFRTPDIQSKYPAGYKIQYRVQQQKNGRLSGPQMNGLAVHRWTA